MLAFAWLGFEIANYMTTELAITDLLGVPASLWGLKWSDLIAISFSLVDFAGIAAVFTPEKGKNEPKEIVYLFIGWLIAASMNAVLTWWAVAMQIEATGVKHTFVDMNKVVVYGPIFIAVLVLIVRIALIGTIITTVDQIFNPRDKSEKTPRRKASKPKTSRATLSPSRPRTALPVSRTTVSKRRTAVPEAPEMPVNISKLDKPSSNGNKAETFTGLFDEFLK